MNRDEIISKIKRLEEIKAVKAEMSKRNMPIAKPSESDQDGVVLPKKVDNIYMGFTVPDEINEFMLGADRRLRDVFSLGNADERSWDKQLDNSGYATAGGILGDVAAMGVGGSALKTAGAIPKIGKGLAWIGQGLNAPKSATQAATAMGLYGAATNEDRLKSSATSAGGGAAGVLVPKIAGAAIKPQISKAVAYMKKKGYPLTTGEMLGGGFKTAEEKAMSLPVVGPLITGAKNRSIQGYSKAVVDDALKPIGKALPEGVSPGRPSIRAANRIIRNKYDDVLSSVNAVQDEQFIGEINELVAGAQKLPQKEYNKFLQVIEEKLIKQTINGRLTGNAYKKVDSGLRQEYKRAIKSQDNYVNDMGEMLRSAHNSLKELAKRQNPEIGNSIDLLDQSYAMMRRVDDAANYAGAHDGVFSPTQYLNATKKGTDKRLFAEGSGFGQDITEAMKDTLIREINDSGTAGRLALNDLLIGGGLGYASPATIPAMVGVGGMYTKPGQSIVNAALFNRPERAGAVRTVLEEIAPFTGLLGGAASQ